jgi:AraC-like DNA-binding protein
MKPAAHVRVENGEGREAPIFAQRRTPDLRNVQRGHVTHDYAAIAFYVGGTARVEQRATWSVRRGDALLVPPGEPHRIVEAHDPDFWSAGFCVPCVAADASSAALLEPFQRVRGGASPVVQVPGERVAFVETLFQELTEVSASRTGHEAVRRSLLTLILNEITRAAHWPAAEAAAIGIVGETLQYIERHCLGPLTLTQIAAAVNRTPSYVTTALTRATGRSAVAWIIAGRMAEARRRLLHSDESVEVIAERVGYADPTHFVRLFRREHGSTPAAWRARLR